ncbi:MAG TPA: LPXTG cell wall anchor domain-containing protein [Chitinophagales bacterium]|jgi:LPXTG-motif cell wall-anchored protein|nr:LPXTG cell wall anchor domain-containing protein [Chitinophagales bacterium]MBP6153413.1 LPXTG cell wall anchor domain-containing protein [Chitinophagales bacterium]HQV79140.1 LPXTG cell wall anchor domain-containing protein [Chitinophagales bacterium]HQW79904.1 LPXTG cell wall anchor domain-containing protein [Chitinophagales bacterium]HRB67018.1 LPXTG cell wall anchor domain-containing protein [Chitinophagales bacterium]
MKRTNYISLFLILFFLSVSIGTQAQCAMCKGSVQTSEYAKSINNGILYLLGFPILLVGGIIFIWIKKRKEFSQTH